MNTRYDPLADTQPDQRPPLQPLPPNRAMWAAVVAIVLTSAVGIAGAFGFDVCAFVHSFGIELDACKVTPTPEPAPAPAQPVEPAPE